MNMIGKITRILLLLEDSRSISALFTWPKFSLTSFLMVSRLENQGILPKTILDVGANAGQFSVASSKFFKDVQVHSFEPVPESVNSLHKNVSRLSNVYVHPIALGDHEGEVTIYVNSHSHSSSVLPLAQTHRDAFPGAQEKEVIKVQLSTLDKILKGITLIHPVLLKLDVQGYEGKVLQGGAETLKRVDYVVLETSFKPMYEGEAIFREILQIMEEKGFSFARPVGWLTSPKNGETLQMDALFVRDSKKQNQ